MGAERLQQFASHRHSLGSLFSAMLAIPGSCGSLCALADGQVSPKGHLLILRFLDLHIFLFFFLSFILIDWKARYGKQELAKGNQ